MKENRQAYLAPPEIRYMRIPVCTALCSSGNLDSESDLNEKFDEFDEFDW